MFTSSTFHYHWFSIFLNYLLKMQLIVFLKKTKQDSFFFKQVELLEVCSTLLKLFKYKELLLQYCAYI